ncbi:MAG: hypothetical protein LQ351_006510 [Letrouitia transgressa]|nr:MAG: hypothetical protein LQ351_006510 [Letrouitia transgressa]
MNFLSTFFSCLLLSYDIVALALPTAAPQPDNSLHNYDIQSCDPDRRGKLSRAIDGAILAAEIAWQDINFEPPRHGYNAFFKTTAYPVKLTFREIANYEPYAPRARHIAWTCVTEHAPQQIQATCAQMSALTYFISRGIIFICPRIFEWPTETPIPDPGQCPGVRDNVFASNINPFIRSNSMLAALAHYRLPPNPRSRGPYNLNTLVAMSARQAYLTPLSYSCYAALAKNRCRQFPDIRLPPWDRYHFGPEPTASTNDTTAQEQETGIELGEVLAEDAGSVEGAKQQLAARAMFAEDVSFDSR